MFKTLRFTLVSLLMMLCGTVFAEEVKIDFTSADEITAMGFALPENGKGTDITEPFIYKGITITPYKGTTNVRIWNSSGAYTFRYFKADTEGNKGGFAVSVPEGSKITQVVITGNSKLADTTCDAGEIAMSNGNKTLTWTPKTESSSVIFSNGGSSTTNVETLTVIYEAGSDSELMKEAKELASDPEAVAVGKLLAAIAAAKESGDESGLQAAIDQFKKDNADQEADQTAKVATNGWKKYDGSAAGVCATQFAPAITTYDGRNAQLAEVYETNVETIGTIIYQDITGLTNGKYKVGFYANAFYTSGRGFESSMADGAEDVAYVFANDEKEFITANIATSTTENNFRQFDVEVTDGTIKLGLGKEQAGTNWHTMQIYQLTWFTTAKEVYAVTKAKMVEEIAAAKALEGTVAKEALNAAIATAEATLTSNMLNIAELEAAIETLKAAEKAFAWAQYNIDNPSGDLLVNGSCNTANEGWTLTNMQYQNNSERPTRYVEKWTDAANGGHLSGEVSAKQVLKDLPAGAFVLRGVANAQQQENKDLEITGVSLYVNDASVNVSGSWKDYEIVFNHLQAGDVEVGFKAIETNANWVGFDEVSLVYYGDYDTYVLAAPKKDYEAALAAAKAAIADEVYAAVTGDEKTNLEAEIAKAEPNTVEGYQEATAALKAMTKVFTDAVSAYNALVAANAYVVDLPYADAAKKPEAKTATNATAAAAAAEEVNAALRGYYESNANAEGVEGAQVLTDVIVNPAAETAIGSEWVTTLGEGSGGAIDIKSNEPWTDAAGNTAHKYFDGGNWGANAWDVTFSQEVTLNAGKYLLSAITRASADVEQTLFAGENNTKTASIGATGGVFNRGWNIHNVEFELDEDATIAIGVHGVTSVLHNWMSFSDFRLVQFPAEPDPMPTAIRNINADQQQETIYNLNGQKVQKTQKGLLIVNGKKLLVK